MSKQNIYPVTSQEVIQFFSHNVSLEKLLVVPCDFAKGEHTVHCCRGTGEYLLKHPLRIFNTIKGADYLEKRIQGLCRKYHISRILCTPWRRRSPQLRHKLYTPIERASV